MERMEEDVSALFRQMDRMRRAWQNITPCSTLSKSQFGTLLAIAFSDVITGACKPDDACGPKPRDRAVTLTELARILHQSLPALSQRVSTLEALGYAERVPDPNDRRVTGVRVTPEGERVLGEAHKRFDRMLMCTIDSLGQERLHTLLELLDGLSSALERVVREENERTENETAACADTAQEGQSADALSENQAGKNQ